MGDISAAAAILAAMSEEASDLSAAAAGDRGAFLRLYDRRAAVVLSFCRRRSWSFEEAEEATQETFLRAYRVLHRVKSPPQWQAWLYKTARHVCAERRRAALRRRRREMKAASEHMDNRRRNLAPGESVEQAEQLERLTAALDELPDDQRLAVHLYYLEAEPAAAASGVLGLSRPGFYRLLARARGRLARLMREGQSG